jgi:hypothetical protein
MRGHHIRTVAATAVLVPAIGTACVTARQSAPNPLLATTLVSLLTAPRSVATFEMEYAAVGKDGSAHWFYNSRGDSTVTAYARIRQFAMRPANDTTFVRVWADRFLADVRKDGDTPSDSLTGPVERNGLTYTTGTGVAVGHRVRTARVVAGKPQGLHIYALMVGQRLIGIEATHPKERDAAAEIDQFAEALARAVSDLDSEDRTTAAALVPAKHIGGYELVDTRQYPTAEAGTQYRFKDSAGHEVDVYVYTGDIARFKGDGMAALTHEVASFRKLLPLGRERGYYSSYSIESDTLLTVRVGERDHPVHRIRMAVTRENRPQDSYFYLAILGGHFVKIRITQPRDAFPLARADAFVHAVLTDLDR